MILLDHLTRGRAMLGVGPGALPTDAAMMGIDPMDLRRRMNESLEAVMRLLDATEPVTMETDWFTLRRALVQLPSYTRPHLPVAVASILSPSGPVAAGRYGLGVISVGGFDADGFARTWDWTEEAAAAAGKTVDRNNWRVVAPVHIAESREQAVADVRDGFRRRAYYGDTGQLTGNAGAIGGALGLGGTDIEESIEAGRVIVGSPDDAIAGLRSIQRRSGGFGKFLILAHEWASTEKTNLSYELWARYVTPVFQNLLEPIAKHAQVAYAHFGEVASLDQSVRGAFKDAGKEIPADVDAALEH
jgi:limonene 1,2-monooxygenase